MATTPDQLDLDVFVRTLWGECRGEPYFGQVAVACVVRNRVRDRRWPSTYAGVCRQRHQFSCWPGVAGVAIEPSLPTWKQIIRIAKSVIADEIPDVVFGANHYINFISPPPDPSWAQNASTYTIWPDGKIIGKHTFLKL